jgi:hypothetical protein
MIYEEWIAVNIPTNQTRMFGSLIVLGEEIFNWKYFFISRQKKRINNILSYKV